MANSRGAWGSKVGFILAASGSAIGLGNIWKFPYITGENGGAAFVIIYLACIAVIGLPLILAEFTLGRKTQKNALGAYRDLSPNSPWWMAGLMGIIAGFMILSFYSVVAGWSFAYIIKAASGLFPSFGDPQMSGSHFGAFVAKPWTLILYHTIFMALTMYIVIGGVKSGIERWSKILMPALLAILVVCLVRSLTLPGAEAGVAFLLEPDFSQVNARSFLVALGHSFFTLSLGMGTMITYGSYLSREDNMPSHAMIVTGLDTLIALLAGLVIFPATFAYGLDPAAGPGLIFNTLPVVFGKMPGGTFFATAFFVLLTIAALTSAISILEVLVAYFVDERGWSRAKATGLMGTAVYLLGIPCALSFSTMSEFKVFGFNFFDLMDFVASNYMLPLGGLMIALFFGVYWGMKNALAEASEGSPQFKGIWTRGWEITVKYISPALVAIIIIAKIFGVEF